MYGQLIIKNSQFSVLYALSFKFPKLIVVKKLKRNFKNES